MRRRGLLAGVLAVAGCGLSERPYEVKRDWPLVARRPQTDTVNADTVNARAADARGKVLLVRSMQAGPGLETRGLRSLQRDGSVRSDFHETWAVPPAQGVEAALRDWLVASGRYAAVLAPGSRMTADFVLETMLTELVADPPRGVARAAMTVVVLEDRGGGARVLAQHVLSADAPLGGGDAPAVAQAMLKALEALLADVEQALAGPTRQA